MLTLPIKRKWFDMICKGQKREEYREPSEYWRVRFNKAMNEYHGCRGQVFKVFPIQIRAGYRADCPTAKLWVHCIYGKGGAREWAPTLKRTILSCRYCTLRKSKIGNGETKSEI